MTVKQGHIAHFLMGIILVLIALCPLSRLQAQLYEDEANEYIFQVLLLPNWTINEAIFAYEQEGKYYLPIGELAKGFEFFADLDIEQQYAQGFASREDNSFILDFRRGEAIIKGDKITLPPNSVLEYDFLATDDLYVDIDILNKIWPVDMTIDLSNLSILTDAQEELSFIRNKGRADNQLILEARQERIAERKELLPRRENDYQWWGKPVIDYQGIYQYETDDGTFNASNIFSGIQQVGKVIADYSVNLRVEDSEVQTPESIRLKLSRQSVGDDYLPVPGIRSFEAGDIALRQRELVSNTETGRGLSVSNSNNTRFDEFDRITVEGSGPPGWDIELYNNDELIDASIVPDDGQYIFDDVVLNFGNNDIKILFFGPQGQVREDVRRYTAGGDMLSPGDFEYTAGVIDLNKDLITLKEDNNFIREGILANGEVRYGINNQVTAFATASNVPDTNDDRQYVTGGIVVSTPLGLTETEIYKQIDGGQAISSSLITSLFGYRTNLLLSLFDGFESQDAGTGGNAKTLEAEAQVNKNIKVFNTPIGLRLNATHTEREETASNSDIRFSQSYSRSGIRVTHSTLTTLRDLSHDKTTGSFITTTRRGPWQLRGGLTYDAFPDTDLSIVNGEIRYRKENSFQASLNSSYDFQTSDYTTGIQLGYDFGTVLSTFETSYQKDRGVEFVLRATSSLNPYTPNGDYTLTSSSRRNYSPVNAFIFLDKDNNGLFDGEDEPLPEAKIKLAGGVSSTETDESGYVIANAPDDRFVNVKVDSGSLVDPYFKAASTGFSFAPIRGKMINASFPVIETGSIEGEVKWRKNGAIVAGLDLNLIDKDGNVIQTVQSAFDGYYSFEFVSPGTYTIEANADENLIMYENLVTLLPEDPFSFGTAIYISQINSLDLFTDSVDPFEDIPLAGPTPGYDPIKALASFYDNPQNYE